MAEPNQRFIIIGTGGTGGHLSRELARTLEYQRPDSALLLVDGDAYEPKNAERQEFRRLGNKATVKAAELQVMFPSIFISPIERWVVEKAPEDSDQHISASDLLQEGDVVYTTVDNFATRALVFEVAREFDNIDVFTGGNDEKLFCSTYHYQRRDGRDVIDHPTLMKAEMQAPPDRNPGEMSCQERAMLDGGTQTIAANMAVASILLARTALTILDGKEDKESEIMLDLEIGMASSYDRRVTPVSTVV